MTHEEDITCPCCAGHGYLGSMYYADKCWVCDGEGLVDPVYLQDLRDQGELLPRDEYS